MPQWCLPAVSATVDCHGDAVVAPGAGLRSGLTRLGCQPLPSVAVPRRLGTLRLDAMLPVVRREAWSAALFAADLELVMSMLPSGPGARGVVFILTRPLHLFWATEARGALLLLGTTVAALVWVNSPWVASYESLWSTRLSVQVGEAELAKDLRHWVNDGLMVLFFLVVGLEISRELKLGELRHWRAMAAPAVAALGGMVVPALVYLAFTAGGPAARGWPIVLATDFTLVLGMLALVGWRCPPQLRVCCC